MRAPRHDRDEQGFVMVIGLFITSLLLTFTSVGLTRSMRELLSADRHGDTMQALHLAEAALDHALLSLQTAQPGSQALDDMLNQTTPCPLNNPAPGAPKCEALVRDDLPNSTHDTNGRVEIEATGIMNGVTQEITALVSLSTGIFDWGVLTWSLEVQEQGQIGDPGNPVPIFAVSTINTANPGAPLPGNPDMRSHVHAASPIRFDNDSPDCPNCADPDIFPGSPALTTDTALGQDMYNDVLRHIGMFDYDPYYNAAMAQPRTDCTGQPYNVITADTVIDGNACPGGKQVLEGVIYVEKGVNVDFAGTVEVRGTIVHEGANQIAGHPTPYNLGHLKLLPNAQVTIDSHAGGISPGLAILGQPIVIVDPFIHPTDPTQSHTTSLQAKGFVILGGSANPNFYNLSILGGADPNLSTLPQYQSDPSSLPKTRIEGGLFTLCQDGSNGIPMNQAGPATNYGSGYAPAAPYDVQFFRRNDSFHGAIIKNGAQVLYQRPPTMPPGFPYGSSFSPRRGAQLLVWRLTDPTD